MVTHDSRALSAAEALSDEGANQEHAQYLTFTLRGEIFGIEILVVREIIGYGSLTEVPMMPSCIRGVINLRGAVVPVMDLSARFDREPSVVTKYTCIVIVETAFDGQQQVIGIVVDAVNAVLEIAPSEIEPAPQFGAKIRSDFIVGMGKVAGKFVILLNVNRVVAIDEVGALALLSNVPASLTPPSATA